MTDTNEAPPSETAQLIRPNFAERLRTYRPKLPAHAIDLVRDVADLPDKLSDQQVSNRFFDTLKKAMIELGYENLYTDIKPAEGLIATQPAHLSDAIQLVHYHIMQAKGGNPQDPSLPTLEQAEALASRLSSALHMQRVDDPARQVPLPFNQIARKRQLELQAEGRQRELETPQLAPHHAAQLRIASQLPYDTKNDYHKRFFKLKPGDETPAFELLLTDTLARLNFVDTEITNDPDIETREDLEMAGNWKALYANPILMDQLIVWAKDEYTQMSTAPKTTRRPDFTNVLHQAGNLLGLVPYTIDLSGLPKNQIQSAEVIPFVPRSPQKG